MAEAAAELGLDSVWATEHHRRPGSAGRVRPRLRAAGRARLDHRLHRARRARDVGPHPPAHHPMRLAKAATLQHLSGGRLLLGVGMAGRGRVPLHGRSVQGARTARRRGDPPHARLWRGETSFAGEHWSFEDASFAPCRSRRPRSGSAAGPSRGAPHARTGRRLASVTKRRARGRTPREGRASRPADRAADDAGAARRSWRRVPREACSRCVMWTSLGRHPISDCPAGCPTVSPRIRIAPGRQEVGAKPVDVEEENMDDTRGGASLGVSCCATAPTRARVSTWSGACRAHAEHESSRSPLRGRRSTLRRSTQFVTPLTIPPAMPRTAKIALKGGKSIDYYEIAVRQFQQQVLPAGLDTTTVWSYGSATTRGTFNYPAFTIEAKWQAPVRVKWINDLRTRTATSSRTSCRSTRRCTGRTRPAGTSDTSALVREHAGPVHRPGADRRPRPRRGGTRLESDGYAEAWYLRADASAHPPTAPGTTSSRQGGGLHGRDPYAVDPESGAVVAGNASSSTRTTSARRTLWYHDHTLGMTRLNVYAGPAGFYLLRGGPATTSAGSLPPPGARAWRPAGHALLRDPARDPGPLVQRRRLALLSRHPRVLRGAQPARRAVSTSRTSARRRRRGATSRRSGNRSSSARRCSSTAPPGRTSTSSSAATASGS